MAYMFRIEIKERSREGLGVKMKKLLKKGAFNGQFLIKNTIHDGFHEL